MKRYRLYGLELLSSLPLTHGVPEAAPTSASSPDLTFELVGEGGAGQPPLPGEGPGEEPAYRSPERLATGEPILTASRAGARILLRYAGEAAFAVGERRIVGRPERPGADGLALVELRLLGPVLACWLERTGVLALHAAAATVDGRAVALLSGNQGGKSCLAATLATAGVPLLSDDVLAVEPVSSGGLLARPSYPQMRLWPEDARRFAGAAGLPFADLARAHPGFDKLRVPLGPGGLGSFDPEARPLAAVYVPERRSGAALAIEPLAPRAALVALLAGSFLPRLGEALGWSARRLDLLARLVRGVPVRRLVVPAGFEHLPRVRDALLADVAGLP